jgi:hypothetical protein
MMVHNHRAIHIIHLFLPIEPQPMGNIIPDINEGPINESNTTLELKDLCTKSHSFLEIWPLNFVVECQIDAKCNENCIIKYSRLVPILKECVIHDNIVMFHV